jgi:hypothetical protein
VLPIFQNSIKAVKPCSLEIKRRWLFLDNQESTMSKAPYNYPEPQDGHYPATVTVYKETDDNWCGSFSLRRSEVLLVRVYFYNIKSINVEFVRVCVFGDDDLGYEKDFEIGKISEAWLVFLKVIAMQKVNFKDLKELGFIYA